MTNFSDKILNADEDPIYHKSYNMGTVGDPGVPVRAIDGPTAPTPVNISFASTDAQTIVAAPGLATRLRICSLHLSAAVNVVVQLKSGSTVIGTIYGQSAAKDWIQPLCLGTNEAFVLQATTADQIYWQVCYWAESIAF